MASNQPPTEEEVDRMVELYDELGTMAAVADHEDVDYAKSTVNKWIRRRTEDDDEDNMEEDLPEDDGRYEAEPTEEAAVVEEEPPIEEQFSDILEDEPPSPNDILWDVLSTDPDIKDKHVEYLRRFEDQYGVFSPDDVSGKLNELKITNKRMTINRVVSNYRTEINRKLQKDDELAQREEWALLLTKTTGNPRYLREADGASNVAQFEQAGPAIGGPVGGQGQPAADQIQAPPPGPNGQQPQQRAAAGNRPQQAAGVGSPAPQRGQQPPEQPAPSPQQQAGGGDEITPFQERLLEMLEQNMDNQPDQPERGGSESDSLSEQIQEIAEIQKTLDSMGGGAGENEELAQAIQQINEKVDQKLARLEAKVAETGGSSDPSPSSQSGGGESGGPMSEIAALAQQIEDPDVLSTVIESQMDPEVIKARAETEEVENDAKFKRALAEALSPKATEKAVEAISNLTSGVSAAAQADRRQRQPVQQPAPAQQQPAQQQQPQQARDVEVVEDEAQPTEEPAMSEPADSSGESSPLREEGEQELGETDTPDDTETEEE